MELRKQVACYSTSVKNLILGFLLGLCVMLVVGAASSSDGPGQYQCCAAGDDSVAVFVIDTQTGQTWRLSRTDAYDLGTPGAPKSVRHSVTPLVR